MKSSVYVIITAAGKGSRFKKDKNNKPKQFLNLNGIPVILYSLLKFQKLKEIKGIYISAEPAYFNCLHSLAAKYKISKLKALVEGGKTRFDSVRNTFNQINCSGNDIILIHDAARPNISAGEIKKLISYAYKNGDVVFGCKVSDTVKKSKGNVITETIPRDNLWLVQTPQAFRYNTLSKAYIISGSKNYFTDESSVVENAGFTVNIIEGSRYNIKITTQDDFKLLRKLLK